MQLLDFITIAVFAAGVVIMGLSFSGKSRNMKSFFAAGGAVPWPMSGLSLFMGFFSAGTFVVWGSIAYTSRLGFRRYPMDDGARRICCRSVHCSALA